MKNLFKSTLLVAMSFTLVMQSAIACTSSQSIAADGTRVYARTMEFAYLLHSDLIVLPRKLQYAGTGPNQQKGASWIGKYGVVGLNGYDQPIIIDGMNEKGMAGGMLHFPGHASYVNPDSVNASKALASWEFLT